MALFLTLRFYPLGPEHQSSQLGKGPDKTHSAGGDVLVLSCLTASGHSYQKAAVGRGQSPSNVALFLTLRFYPLGPDKQISLHRLAFAVAAIVLSYS